MAAPIPVSEVDLKKLCCLCIQPLADKDYVNCSQHDYSELSECIKKVYNIDVSIFLVKQNKVSSKKK